MKTCGRCKWLAMGREGRAVMQHRADCPKAGREIDEDQECLAGATDALAKNLHELVLLLDTAHSDRVRDLIANIRRAQMRATFSDLCIDLRTGAVQPPACA